ncbi:hypothetical protein F5144DRAFT_57829 [Chaetomium tenue]|uniref:Uncharacterized protein n=1 Tax=Chaetomium tenue TaxID=1854479 RepID=A0ACB7PQS2_9PEZI|nr:hypothetical protein F5144DRAFT_57829 [Chaetomium globosum]
MQQPTGPLSGEQGDNLGLGSGDATPLHTAHSTTEPVPSGAASAESGPITATPAANHLQQGQGPVVTREPGLESAASQSWDNKNNGQENNTIHEGQQSALSTERVQEPSVYRVAVDETQSSTGKDIEAQSTESEILSHRALCEPPTYEAIVIGPEREHLAPAASPIGTPPDEAQPTSLRERPSTPSDSDSEPDSISQDMPLQPDEDRSPYSLLNKSKKKRKKPKAEAEPWPVESPEAQSAAVPTYGVPVYESRPRERKQLSTVVEETEPPSEYGDGDTRSLISGDDNQSLQRRKSIVSESSHTVSSLGFSSETSAGSLADDEGGEPHVNSLKKVAGKKKKGAAKHDAELTSEPIAPVLEDHVMFEEPATIEEPTKGEEPALQVEETAPAPLAPVEEPTILEGPTAVEEPRAVEEPTTPLPTEVEVPAPEVSELVVTPVQETEPVDAQADVAEPQAEELAPPLPTRVEQPVHEAPEPAAEVAQQVREPAPEFDSKPTEETPKPPVEIPQDAAQPEITTIKESAIEEPVQENTEPISTMPDPVEEPKTATVEEMLAPEEPAGKEPVAEAPVVEKPAAEETPVQPQEEIQQPPENRQPLRAVVPQGAIVEDVPETETMTPPPPPEQPPVANDRALAVEEPVPAADESSGDPEKPGSPIPDVPSAPVPDVPNSPVPEVPDKPTPKVPSEPAPEVPTQPAPEVPGDSVSGKPTPAPEPQPEEASAQSAKKAKKDKKKRKGKGLQILDPESEARTTPTAISEEQNPVVDEPAPGTEASAVVDEISAVTEELAQEPEVSAPPLAEDTMPMPETTTAAGEPTLLTEEPVIPAEEAAVPTEESALPAEEPTPAPEEPVSIPEPPITQEPKAEVSLEAGAEPVIAEEAVPIVAEADKEAEPILEAQPEPEQILETPTKKSKKKKKGKGSRATDIEDPSTSTPTVVEEPISRELEETTPAVEGVTEPETQIDDAPTTPTKKGKDKKNTEVEPEPQPEPESLAVSQPDALNLPGSNEPTTTAIEDTPETLAEPTPEKPESVSELVQESAADPEPKETVAEQEAPQGQPQEAITELIDAKPRELESTLVGGAPEPEPTSESATERIPEAEQSTAIVEPLKTEPEVPVATDPTEQDAVSQEPSQEARLATTGAQARELDLAAELQPQPEEALDVPPKKSKKDKKKKKGKGKTAAPGPEPEIEAVLEPKVEPTIDPAAETTTEPVVETVAERALMHPIGLSTEALPEPATEGVFEAAPEPGSGSVAEPVVEVINRPVAEPVAESVAESPAAVSQEAQEDTWEPPTKKSKKDKKRKGSKQIAHEPADIQVEAPAVPEPVQMEESSALEHVHLQETREVPEPIQLGTTPDVLEPIQAQEPPAAPESIQFETPTSRALMEEPTGVQAINDHQAVDILPAGTAEEDGEDEEVVHFTGKKSKKDKKKGKMTDAILPVAGFATAITAGVALADEDFGLSSKKGEIAPEVEDKPAAEASKDVQENPIGDEKHPEVVGTAPFTGSEETNGNNKVEDSRPHSPIDEKPEIHPAVSEALRESPFLAPTTIGLGLIPNPPEPYPEDAPSPKLLSGLQTPFSLDAQVEASRQLGVDMTPAQDSSHVDHEPPFDYDAHRKKAKTEKLEAEAAELSEPVVTARDAEEVCLVEDKGLGKEKGEEREHEHDHDKLVGGVALAAAAGAFTGGVSLLVDEIGSEKGGHEERERMGVVADNQNSAERGVDSEETREFKAEPMVLEVDHEEKKEEVEEIKKRNFEPATMEMDEPEHQNDKGLDLQGPTMENETSVESHNPHGLGRMDSETIPRSIRGPYAAGDAPSKKGKGERGGKKEQLERSESPEPAVQRAFSFPDDIADEEVFNTREPSKEAEGSDKKGAEPAANERVRLPALSNLSDFMRSHSSLPPVQEELSDEEAADDQRLESPTPHNHSRNFAKTPELHHRDSGFSSGSPHLSRSLAIPDDHDVDTLRDSGVHLRDSGGSLTPPVRETHRSLSPRIPDERLGLHTPRNRNEDAERRFRRSPLSGHGGVVSAVGAIGPETPRLCEPSPPPQTPEPEKLQVTKKRAPASTSAAITPHVSAIGGGGAPVQSPSDSAHRLPRPTDPNPNPTAHRMSSNTSLARLRTPELPAALRPDTPGTLRSSSGGTPPLQLRRMDKRTSGDLRSASLGQLGLDAKTREQETNQNLASAAAAAAAGGIAAGVGATAALGTLHLQSPPLPLPANSSRSAQNTTPVANEGRVRAKDMTDVFVCFFFLFLIPRSS